MHAVLLFSAALHAAMLGMIAAHAIRQWSEVRRRRMPNVPAMNMIAGVLALAVAVVATLLIWTARVFAVALVDGLLAGLVTGFAFLLYLGVSPLPVSPDGSPPTLVARRTAVSFVALILAVELIAVCFTAAMVGTS